MKNNIEITNSAEVYLKKLIDGKDEDNLGIRIFIDRPGTPKAETCLAFCNIDEVSKDDEVMHLELIDVFIDSKSIDFLKDAIVNFDEDNFDGQLTIKAPNAKMPNIGENSTFQGVVLAAELVKDGIETTLIEQIPEIRSVKDITDHSINENAYYPQEQES